MDKIRLSIDDINFILSWRDEHKDLVRLNVNPLKAVKIVCYESGYIITALRDVKTLKLGISQSGKSLGALTFKIMNGGLYQLIKNTTKLSPEDRQAALTVYASTMAILVFGKATIKEDSREIVPRKPKSSKHDIKRNKRGGYVYILAKTSDKLPAQPAEKRNSPRGMFSVRGHYRHYKNGKTVWINEYRKGTGKKRDKTYKLGEANG